MIRARLGSAWPSPGLTFSLRAAGITGLSIGKIL
jgi:hypothetical protein